MPASTKEVEFAMKQGEKLPWKYDLRDKCQSCDTPWLIHPGLIPLCHRHQVALQGLEKIATLKDGKAKRLAAATLRLLAHCK